MRPAALVLLLGTLLALAGAAPAVAADRLDALAATLRERPLAIDPELGWLLDAREERRTLRALQGSPVPIYAAVLPKLETDESGGDAKRIGAALHRRLGRPGLYVLVDQRGGFDAVAFEVPRSGAYGYELTGYPSRNERGPKFVPPRMERLVDHLVGLPAGTTTSTITPRPLEPYEPLGSRSYDGEARSFGSMALGAGFLFGTLGLLGGGAARAVEGRRRRHEAEAARVREVARQRRETELRRRMEAERQVRARRERRPRWRRLW